MHYILPVLFYLFHRAYVGFSRCVRAWNTLAFLRASGTFLEKHDCISAAESYKSEPAVSVAAALNSSLSSIIKGTTDV